MFMISSTLNATLISFNVGAVGAEAITSREVNIQFIVEKVLYEGGRGKYQLPLKSDVLKQEVSALLLEKVVYKEAVSFQVAEVSKVELEQLRKLFLKNLGRSSYLRYWNSLEVGRAELNTMLRQKLRSKKFIEFKRKSSEVAVSDQEAKDYYLKNSKKFGSLAFAGLKESIKNYLKREQSSKRLSNWFESLRNKYEVSSNLPD